MTRATRQLTEADLSVEPLNAAQQQPGGVLRAESPAGPVAVRLVEVEAYRGADDPASHCYRGMTPRNAVMFGPAGRLYVYFVYGMHFCANVVCRTDGVPGAVLLRAGEVVEGLELARSRRPTARTDAELARGPARLTTVLGLDREDNGAELVSAESPVRLLAGRRVPSSQVSTGPRVGVAAAMDEPWRFWVTGSAAVSAYRRGGKRTRQ
jgi:DNA-3-methyladenine glycosylase